MLPATRPVHLALSCPAFRDPRVGLAATATLLILLSLSAGEIPRAASSHDEPSNRRPHGHHGAAAGRSPDGSGSCPTACRGNGGYCDDSRGVCVCPPLYSGEDCSVFLAPSCRVHTNYTLPCASDSASSIPKPCMCAMECESALGVVPMDERCLAYVPPQGDTPSLAEVARALASARLVQRRSAPMKMCQRGSHRAPDSISNHHGHNNNDNNALRGGGGGGGDRAHEATPYMLHPGREELCMDLQQPAPQGGGESPMAARPLYECHLSCSGHGWCRAMVTGQPPMCVCFPGYEGRGCERDKPTWCPAACNLRGDCIQSFCRCHAGYFGMDCAYVADASRPSGRALWWEWEHGEASLSRPSIFVYDLPGSFNIHLALSATAGAAPRDFMRAISPAFLERVLASRHRTADPATADYFFVPVLGDVVYGRIAEALRWVRDNHPETWDRGRGRGEGEGEGEGGGEEGAEGGGARADHLVLVTHDSGATAYFCEKHMSRYRLFAETVMGLPSRSLMEEYQELGRRVIFLQHMGITLPMEASGWKACTRAPVPQHGQARLLPTFLPGKDILIPPDTGLEDVSLASPFMQAAPQERTILMYFAGEVPRPTHPTVRSKVFDAVRRPDGSFSPDVMLIDTLRQGKDPKYYQHMAQSVFCLGLPGKSDGWGRRTILAILLGCIPVIVEDNRAQMFEEVLPWDRFSVRVAEEDVATLEDKLRSIEPETVASMQRQLACVWPMLLWTSVFGSVVGAPVDGGEASDAFAMLMEVLRRRAELLPVDSSAAADDGPSSVMPQVAEDGCVLRAGLEESYRLRVGLGGSRRGNRGRENSGGSDRDAHGREKHEGEGNGGGAPEGAVCLCASRHVSAREFFAEKAKQGYRVCGRGREKWPPGGAACDGKNDRPC
eukprot:jgi/Mesvir1/11918/Mv00256-RA.1